VIAWGGGNRERQAGWSSHQPSSSHQESAMLQPLNQAVSGNRQMFAYHFVALENAPIVSFAERNPRRARDRMAK
jgi:hypothetical protein